MNKFLLFSAAAVAAGCLRAAIQPIEGTNVVGFAALNAPVSTNTIITVPFEACMGNGAPGTLADLVATNGLTSHASDPALADQLVVLTTGDAGQVYYYYWYATDAGWTGIETEKLMPGGTNGVVTPPAATAFTLDRGLGFWIKRAPGASQTLYVKGQVSSAKQATPIDVGLNLVGYGTVSSFSLNGGGVDWTGAYGGTGNTSTSDKIIVCNGGGTFTEYFYFVKPESWGAAYDALSNKWITKSYEVADVTLAAGQGFWYLRRGAGSFTFHPDGE